MIVYFPLTCAVTCFKIAVFSNENLTMAELDIVFEKLSLTTSDDTLETKEKIVSFAGKGLSVDTEEDANEIVENIQNCISMTTLCLEGNTIGVPGAKAIGEALESQSDFKKAFWSDIFTRRTQIEIPDALLHLSSGIKTANAQLTILDLSDNAFGPRGLKGIIEFLSSSPCYTLHELYLNNNGLGVEGAMMLASALTTCFTNSQINGNTPLPLKVFACGRNRLENEGCIAIAEALKNIKTLQHVSMPQNGIYSDGIESLAKNLINCNELLHLNLNDNTFGKEGADEMAKSLSFFKDIEVLNFGDCLLRSDGAKVIANALQENCPKLQELHLGYNEINFNSGLEIIKAVVNKENFKKLNLNGNQFGEKGCILIQKLLKDSGKENQLESLSEDEGSDDSDNDVSEGENEKDSVEDPITNELVIANKLEDFMNEPTLEKLIELHGLEINKFIAFMDLTATECFDLFIKISFIIDLEDENTMKIMYDFTDTVLSKAFESCSDLEMWKVNSEFTIQLGLIKSEYETNKTFNHHGLFVLLNHAVKQNYFRSSTKELFKFLLPRTFKNNDDEEMKVLLEYLDVT